jgi:hypothetical protein
MAKPIGGSIAKDSEQIPEESESCSVLGLGVWGAAMLRPYKLWWWETDR